MKRFYQKLIITFTAIVVGLFGLAQTAAAASLDVVFEQEPLFSEANFLPGDAVQRYVQVTNNSGVALDIAVQSSDISDPDLLGDQIELVVKEGATELFSGSLTDFFDVSAGPLDAMFLSSLADGASTQYDFFATFKPETGNDYQEDSLSFDLTFGSIGESDNGGGGPVQTFGGPGGGGLPKFIPDFVPPENGEVGGVNTTTPPGGPLAYNPPSSPPAGTGVTSGSGAFVPAGEIGEVGTTAEKGEVLGEETSEPEGEVCEKLWWWFIGYIVYAVLLFLAYWMDRKKKSFWVYVLPVVLTIAAILWWWFEPCPSHFWVWPAVIVVWLVGWTVWHIYQSKNNQQELPFEKQVESQSPPTDS